MPTEAPPAPPAAPAAAPATSAPAAPPAPASTGRALPSGRSTPPGDRAKPSEPAKPGASLRERLIAKADIPGAPVPGQQPPVEAPKTPTSEQTPPKPADAPEPPPAGTEPPPAPKIEPPVESMGLKQLRTAYETTKRERDTFKRQYEELKAKPPEDPEKVKLAETAEKTAKELETLRKEMEFVDYERSEPYKKTYEQPYLQAFQRARTKMGEFDVVTAEGATRPGTDADFDMIASLPSNREARIRAKEMFPDDWQAVLALREGVLEKNEARVTALEEKRKEGAEVVKQRQETRVQEQKKIVQALSDAWKTHVTAAHDQFPQYFKPVEGDEKGNELLEQGFAAAHAAFRVMNPADPNLTPSQREAALKAHTVAFNKMAAFDRLAYQLVELKKKFEAAEEKLKNFEGSEPGPGAGAPAKTDAPSDRITRMAKYAR